MSFMIDEEDAGRGAVRSLYCRVLLDTPTPEIFDVVPAKFSASALPVPQLHFTLLAIFHRLRFRHLGCQNKSDCLTFGACFVFAPEG